MLSERYPADGKSVGIEILGNAASDDEDVFWRTEPENVRRQFDTILRPRIASRARPKNLSRECCHKPGAGGRFWHPRASQLDGD